MSVETITDVIQTMSFETMKNQITHFELKSRTLMTDNQSHTNAYLISFHTRCSTKETLKILKQFKDELQGIDSPFKAMLINGVCFIIDSSKCPYKLLPYILDLDDTAYPTPSNVTIYVRERYDSLYKMCGIFSQYSQFFVKLYMAFGSKVIFNFIEAHIAVLPEMGYTPINWLQFEYKSSGNMVYWQYRHADLFLYEESPYRLFLLGGTAYIFQKEDCPKHWKPLFSTLARCHNYVLNHSVLNQHDTFKYENGKEFELSWANDSILAPALQETTLIHNTGSIKHNGCSIVYPGIMNPW